MMNLQVDEWFRSTEHHKNFAHCVRCVVLRWDASEFTPNVQENILTYVI